MYTGNASTLFLYAGRLYDFRLEPKRTYKSNDRFFIFLFHPFSPPPHYAAIPILLLYLFLTATPAAFVVSVSKKRYKKRLERIKK